MTMKLQCYSIVIPIALMIQAGPSAQSLADIARAEEARRKTVKAAAKVYTNEDLGRTPDTSPAPIRDSAPNPSATPAAAAVKSDEQKAAADPTKTEAHWRDRASVIQQSLSRSKLLLDALQSQVNGLNAEFVNTDDPGQRGLVEARLKRAGGELQRVQQDIEKQTKAAADLQEEARKSNVPAGWVR